MATQTTQICVVPVSVMDDETLMLHLENRHTNELLMEFQPEPDRTERRLHAPKEWRSFHAALHRRAESAGYDHFHTEEDEDA